MTIVLSIAGAAALVVIAYEDIRSRSPEASTAGLRAVRELAAVVLVCVKAVEGIADVLGGHQRQPAPSLGGWAQRSSYNPYDDDDFEEDER